MTVHLIVSLNCSAEEQEQVRLSDKADKEKYRIVDEALDREKRQIKEAD